MISPRSNYITLLKSRRNRSIEKTREAYLGHKNPMKLKLDKSKHQSSDDRRNKLTDRKNSLNKCHSTNRSSLSKLQPIASRKLSKDKSKKEVSSWSKTCSTMKKNQYQDQRKKNEEGDNCRIVIMGNGKNQSEYFLTVKESQDINKYLAKTVPQGGFMTVPRHISLEFILTQHGITGDFLNGQTIYLKQDPVHHYNRDNVCMQDFEIIKPIGSGGFSKVFLCKSKIDNNFYAMKLIQKEMVVKNKKKKIVMNERVIMEESKHPFIIDLKYAFEAEKYIVFVLEYCAGGELFGLIKKFRRLSEDMARFYIIEIFLGLSYLHSRKVIYRDIKPQNILLGIDGHVKIADLGLAKPNMHEGELAYSFCGSPEYMSPEMIMQVGHTYPVDFYCMGALLYELLVGLPPFYSQDPEQIYEAVLVEQLTYPDDLVLTPECKNLLKSLLCKDPKKRLGSMYGTKQILAHPWFGKQKYQSYMSKKVDPPLNFLHIEKLNLDSKPDDKNKDCWEKVLREQKYEKKQFKEVMKNFYYNFNLGADRDRDREREREKEKERERERSKDRERSKEKERLSKMNTQRSLSRRGSSTKLSCELQKQNIQVKKHQKGNGVVVTKSPLQKMFNAF